ncbi:hypothetical protein [Streptomyces sp. NPDC092903]|uniref:hypothetical protein n=1 Tax=Streptomyces sp. NPDC092903 TaxID=3366017 RepID=UPI0038087F32
MAASDAKGAGEGQPVGVEAGSVSGVVHDVPECVVDKKEAVDFLLDAVGVLGAQDEAVSACRRTRERAGPRTDERARFLMR